MRGHLVLDGVDEIDLPLAREEDPSQHELEEGVDRFAAPPTKAGNADDLEPVAPLADGWRLGEREAEPLREEGRDDHDPRPSRREASREAERLALHAATRIDLVDDDRDPEIGWS